MQAASHYLRTIIINLRDGKTQAALAAIPLLLGVAASGATTHEYIVAVDAALSRLEVEARFGEPVRDIFARAGNAREFLDGARDCDSGLQLRVRGRRLMLPRSGIRCLSYTIDARRASESGLSGDFLHPANIAVSPAMWMWRPRLFGNDSVRVRFNLPDDMQVSVPWQRIDDHSDTYRFGASPQSGEAIAVFGQLEAATEIVAGVPLRIVFLRTHNDIDTGPLRDWVRATAENVALAYGRFPTPSARVVVIPVGGHRWGGDDAVPFGQVVRDGGETIHLLINERRPVAEYYEQWTPTHEFSHLLLPYLTAQHRWVSEGFATYYQNVLLARAGQYSEETAWNRIIAGLERGRASAPDKSPNAAAAAGLRTARMKIYWSGVAFALIADVELRRRSGGGESLDMVLGRLQQCCLPSSRSWSGPELFRRLDSLLEEPLFMELYGKYANTPGFPDAGFVLDKLGVISTGDSVRLSNTAELAPLRQALMAQRIRSQKRGSASH